MNFLKIFSKKTNHGAIEAEEQPISTKNVENKMIEKTLEYKDYLENEVSRLRDVITRDQYELYENQVEIRIKNKKNEELKLQNENLQKELEQYKTFYEYMCRHRSEIEELFDAAETEKNRLRKKSYLED